MTEFITSTLTYASQERILEQYGTETGEGKRSRLVTKGNVVAAIRAGDPLVNFVSQSAFHRDGAQFDLLEAVSEWGPVVVVELRDRARPDRLITSIEAQHNDATGQVEVSFR